jgi:hypothetical protein
MPMIVEPLVLLHDGATANRSPDICPPAPSESEARVPGCVAAPVKRVSECAAAESSEVGAAGFKKNTTAIDCDCVVELHDVSKTGHYHLISLQEHEVA